MADYPLYELHDEIEMRWLSPENYDGARGAGGKTNFGRKGSPCRGALKAGETWVLGEGTGTGALRRFWITVSDWSPDVLRGVVLRMYWDGAAKPAVEVPLADFFCSHHGRRHVFSNTWFNNPEGRNWNCMIPMPFRTSFRVTVTNDSAREVPMFWYHIDYTLGDKHDANTGYFHAYWNRENPTTLRRDFKILPQIRGRGRYLGCSLGLITRPWYNTWWGEGEVKIYLDGDTEHPTLCGTGTEDYMCSAWGIGNFSLPWYGYQAHPVADPDRMQASMYRLHGPDPVYFKREIRVELQQIGYWGGDATARQLAATHHPGLTLAGDGTQFVPTDEVVESLRVPVALFEREDDWCSTAYFYLDRPASDLPALAPLASRLADLTGDPSPTDYLAVRLEKALLWLPAKERLTPALFHDGMMVHERLVRLSALADRHADLRKAVADARKEVVDHPDTPATQRLQASLARIESMGLASAAYSAALKRLEVLLRRDPRMPIIVTGFKASPLMPKAADIGKASLPKAGLVNRKIPFVATSELADIRGVHGGKDGLVYLESVVKMTASAKGVLAYGADGPVKAWVNGKAVDCRPDATNPAVIGQYRAEVPWRKGPNRLVFAINTNCGKAWGVVVRVLRTV